MKAAYELRRESSTFTEGHCKDGANDTVFSSGDARPGFMDGLRGVEGGVCFGSFGGIAETKNVAS
jgi:hypothetical protein